MNLFKALIPALVFVSLSASAQTMLTNIDAQFVCLVGANSQYSFNLTIGAEKAWMSAPNAVQGIPLKVSQVLRAKCPGCYSVKADWDGGKFEFGISGNAAEGSNKITVLALGNPEDGDEPITSEGVCKKAK